MLTLFLKVNNLKLNSHLQLVPPRLSLLALLALHTSLDYLAPSQAVERVCPNCRLYYVFHRLIRVATMSVLARLGFFSTRLGIFGGLVIKHFCMRF